MSAITIAERLIATDPAGINDEISEAEQVQYYLSN